MDIQRSFASSASEWSTTLRSEYYKEGGVKTLTIQTYDRSAEARDECKKHYGYRCYACGFDFFENYEDIGLNYVEVHHLNQLADAGGEHFVNPIKDLRPVCKLSSDASHGTSSAIHREAYRTDEYSKF